ncbi:formylmethanofuran--tetrahydromethanopterin N-formyltransferase [Aminithiophilus ramosus]|uniref:Formylmethanofuran--tetrahydromethanopterin formyltransferase n=2 Tax=Synergistales TaxID=649776 RepID=A0A9Q7EV41_9BACT|nr:formylmethanofuran--tetrahydromethanopterin N-formyltransferase [Aminithiophilus ramosus]QTX31704.1 formylmethanofuran--tetrahydromethanopterin N-formyltransferase [Aminithiophilus ramosus]QVL35526.1 formylmethanofuran--tetrahydromethanopterin N-formyltransferase [Synergistota bacterium]
MRFRGVEIEGTYAEAFKMWGARLLITAESSRWARIAAVAASGFALSVIGCGCEAGIEEELAPEKTPDGRPGATVLLFASSRKDLEKQLLLRVGQGVMTCATTACFDGLDEGEESLVVGGKLRYFGDGFQGSKVIGGRRLWRIPVMDGEFLVEDRFSIRRGVGGGNFLILASSLEAGLASAEAAAEAMRKVKGTILPFPGGIVRSGSKVGSRYKFLSASTNSPYCPGLVSLVETSLPEGVNAVYELVIDGLDERSVAKAMAVGLEAAALPGVVALSAGNYGGGLGPFHFHLQEILSGKVGDLS